MPTIVIRGPDGNQQEQDVAEQLTIGRADGNDLILSEGGVSRQHARFFVDGGELFVEDVKSANGTWVDGNRIGEATKLTSKSQVLIGDYEISLKVGSKPLPKASKLGAKPSKEPTAAAGKPLKANGSGQRSTRVVPAMKPSGEKSSALAKRPAPGKAAGPQLRGLTGGVTGKTFPLSGTMLVGRVGGVDLQIDDDSVSRKHAEITVRGREVSVKDLGSANGTTVNGAPISDETILSPGDIVQFGVVEVMFETGSTSGARSPVRRTGGGTPERSAPVRSRRSIDDDLPAPPPPETGAPMDPKKKRMLLIAGGTIGFLFLLILVKALTAPPPPIEDKTPLAGGGKGIKKQPVQRDPAEEIEDLLTQCRTYSSSEAGTKPDWARAKAACEKVLELEPIQPDANTLLKKIETEKKCEEALDKAREQIAAAHVEESLDYFAKVKPDCPTYYLKALAAAKDPVAEVKKQAGAECKQYAANAKWENAYKRCEVYARLACQTMESRELYPPALMKMKLDGPLNPKTDWRPTDTLYINFLKAREKLKPGEPMWQCPEIPAFRPPPPPPDPGKIAKDELAKRFSEPEMGKALVLYFEGRFADAPLPLQKIKENMSKAALHDQAKALLNDVNDAINFYENGVTELGKEKPEIAAEHFKKAMAIDERLILGDKAAKLPEEERRKEIEKRASFVRRNIVESMSSKCYQKGKTSADRKDFRQACKVWKLGAAFSRGNIDLLKALTNVCTKRAGETLDRAENCEGLKAAMDFAVDGDGYKEKIEAAMTESGCN